MGYKLKIKVEPYQWVKKKYIQKIDSRYLAQSLLIKNPRYQELSQKIPDLQKKIHENQKMIEKISSQMEKLEKSLKEGVQYTYYSFSGAYRAKHILYVPRKFSPAVRRKRRKMYQELSTLKKDLQKRKAQQNGWQKELQNLIYEKKSLSPYKRKRTYKNYTFSEIRFFFQVSSTFLISFSKGDKILWKKRFPFFRNLRRVVTKGVHPKDCHGYLEKKPDSFSPKVLEKQIEEALSQKMLESLDQIQKILAKGCLQKSRTLKALGKEEESKEYLLRYLLISNQRKLRDVVKRIF
ncbi:MAG: hypothetical protein D6785_15155 [Planctomycetota bacterium]|nr:MAG: hypothetical protein D6785_15155 [Planctomycetota bacterium]